MFQLLFGFIETLKSMGTIQISWAKLISKTYEESQEVLDEVALGYSVRSIPALSLLGTCSLTQLSTPSERPKVGILGSQIVVFGSQHAPSVVVMQGHEGSPIPSKNHPTRFMPTHGIPADGFCIEVSSRPPQAKECPVFLFPFPPTSPRNQFFTLFLIDFEGCFSSHSITTSPWTIRSS